MNIDAIKNIFGDSILETSTFRDELTVTVDRKAIIPLGLFLRDEPAYAFAFLSDLCGVDRLPDKPRFNVVYHLYSLKHGHRLRLRVPVEEEDPVIDSVTSVWETADWHERECFDLYGIQFQNHPCLKRILLPDDFIGHPLRKDFPLEGIKSE